MDGPRFTSLHINNMSDPICMLSAFRECITFDDEVELADLDDFTGTETDFMSITIELDPTSGDYSFKKYDKRTQLPFDWIDLTSFNSNRPVRTAYSLIKSLTARNMFLGSTAEFVTASIRQDIQRMGKRGFTDNRRLRDLAKETLRTYIDCPGLRFRVRDVIDNI